jgi:hypothetical protein
MPLSRQPAERPATSEPGQVAKAETAPQAKTTVKVEEGEPVKKAGPLPGGLFANGPVRFLSELKEFDVRPGQWPFKKGDTGEGKPIVVGGVRSRHGLGMHPPVAPEAASVKYRLGGEAVVFKATVAINDTTDWCWSPAIFTVLGDGKELWQSRFIAHNHARSQDCQVLVRGVDVLELRVHVPNLNQGVQAVWVEPRVLQKVDSPDRPGEPAADDKRPDPPQPASGGPKTYLADLAEVASGGFNVGWKLGKGGVFGDEKGTPIRVDGKPYAKALGMHPPSTVGAEPAWVKYDLGGRATKFEATVAFNDTGVSVFNVPVTFEVVADGDVLWKSPPIRKGETARCVADVTNVRQLELRVRCGLVNDGAHAVWLDPAIWMVEKR